jgi:hypothetical protein
LGLDGGEAKFYVYIQSTTMERPDLREDHGASPSLFLIPTHAQQLVIIQWMDSCIPKEERVLPENKTNYSSSWFW